MRTRSTRVPALFAALGMAGTVVPARADAPAALFIASIDHIDHATSRRLKPSLYRPAPTLADCNGAIALEASRFKGVVTGQCSDQDGEHVLSHLICVGGTTVSMCSGAFGTPPHSHWTAGELYGIAAVLGRFSQSLSHQPGTP